MSDRAKRMREVLQAVQSDAKRYRWLRNNGYTDPMHNFTTHYKGPALDEAIDKTRIIFDNRKES